jgi:serine/threonine protein kinase
MPNASGTGLGPYEILSPIGEGGVAEVYKARDSSLDRTVAIKLPKEAFSDVKRGRWLRSIMRISATFTTSGNAHSIRSAAIGSTREARRAGT